MDGTGRSRSKPTSLAATGAGAMGSGVSASGSGAVASGWGAVASGGVQWPRAQLTPG